MPVLSLRLKVYILAVLVAGAGLIGHMSTDGTGQRAVHKMMLAGIFAGFIAAAGIYPIPVVPRTRIYVSTPAIFAAALLFAPIIAVLFTITAIAVSNHGKKEVCQRQ